MGEVYRADDLRLRQPVALKFLPPRLRHDAEAGERMLQEIRLARRISHPNVCRVYDLGESEGRQFLSMEFVDGEDLASLLRRIGRLPHEKGIEIAHQLCAALSAAHAQGVLHRDLKPANVMLDGEGRLRLTDFGVAAVARHYYARSELAGTLAYMAPEQLRGQPASVQTDLYALGLVLHELFTGRREGSGAAAIDPSSIAHSSGVCRRIPRCVLGRPRRWGRYCLAAISSPESSLQAKRRRQNLSRLQVPLR